jgi:hypothetical protein
MNKVILVTNPLEPNESRKEFDVSDVSAFLMSQWSTLPDGVVIYHETLGNDVTPFDEDSVEAFMELTGTFYVYVYPNGAAAIPYIIYALLVVTAVVLANQLKPDPVVPAAARNLQSSSPNNDLSTRTNRARPNGRIPDIFGEQVSTPDLIAVTYSVYDDQHRELEYAYMCIGRGEYSFDQTKIRDAETRLLDISGTAVEIYGPNTSPNSGSPILSIGEIDEPVLYVQKSNSVNGQLMLPPSEGSAYIFTGSLKFASPWSFHHEVPGLDLNNIFSSSGGIGFPALYVTIEADPYPDPLGGPPINLSGRYRAGLGPFYMNLYHPDQEVDEDPMPELVNEDWLRHRAAWPYPGTQFGPLVSAFVYEDDISSEAWIGPFTLDNTSLTSVISNFVAPNGMYKDNGLIQEIASVACQMEITRVDQAGNATSVPEYFNFSIDGSADTRDKRAKTIRPDDMPRGRIKVRARRLTRRDEAYEGQVIDEVRWKDLYGTYVMSNDHFGDVTTIQSKTYATDGALALKERKLNLDVVRKVKTFSATPTTYTINPILAPSKKMADIFVHMALDPFIGNRQPQDLNFYEIQQAQLACHERFGTTKSGEFCYTFDKDNMSFEECASIVTNSAFCLPYRRGHVITTSFEGPTDEVKLAFGHRNKVPNTEKRTYTFGDEGDFDGIEYNYMSEIGQTPKTYYIPTDRSATNPKKIDSVGIRNDLQAYFHAHRIFNKMFKQRIAVEFEATREAELLVKNDPILVADNTRPNTQDGEIVSKAGLVITTSQPVAMLDWKTYTVFIQLTDGTVQPIAATPGANQYQITLAEEPELALSLNPSNFTLASYILVADDDPRVKQFIVQERTTNNAYTHTVQAINYDPIYYSKDEDYKNRLIDENLNVPAPQPFSEWSAPFMWFQSNGFVFFGPGQAEPYPSWFSGAPLENIGDSYWVKLTRMNGTPGLKIINVADGMESDPVDFVDWVQVSATIGFMAAVEDDVTLISGFTRYSVEFSTSSDGSSGLVYCEAVFLYGEAAP